MRQYKINLPDSLSLDRVREKIIEAAECFHTVDEIRDWAVHTLEAEKINGMRVEGRDYPDDRQWDEYYELRDWVQTPEFLHWIVSGKSCPEWIHRAVVWELLCRPLDQ